MYQMLWMFSARYCGNVGTILVHDIYDLQEVCRKKKSYKLCVCFITKSWKALQRSGGYKYFVKTGEISFWDHELCSTISFEGHILYV